MLFFKEFGDKNTISTMRMSPKIHTVQTMFRAFPTHPFTNETDFEYALYFR